MYEWIRRNLLKRFSFICKSFCVCVLKEALLCVSISEGMVQGVGWKFGENVRVKNKIRSFERMRQKMT